LTSAEWVLGVWLQALMVKAMVVMAQRVANRFILILLLRFIGA
jgi:hypothetical protein